MTKYGFVRVAACAPRIKVADVSYNAEQIINNIETLSKENVSIILFPELSLTGYTCGDLFQQNTLLNAAKIDLMRIAGHVFGPIVVVGLPMYHNSRLWNVAAVIANGRVVGYVPKSYMPTYKEYYESRWFSSGFKVNDYVDNIPFASHSIFNVSLHHNHEASFNFKFGIEVCEDLWLPLSPSTIMALKGASLILNPSASTETIGKADYRRELISQQSSKNVLAYLYAASGPTESTTDVVFSGHCLAAEYGSILEESPLYQRDGTSIITEFDIERIESERRKLTTFGDQVANYEDGQFGEYKSPTIDIVINDDNDDIIRSVDPTPFIPHNIMSMDKRATEIFNIQTQGLATRLENCHTKGIAIGVSGGLDSTLALIVAVKAVDLLGWKRTSIHGITMPGFGTTNKTKSNAILLMEKLGITLKEIPIGAACTQHFKDIGLSENDRTITYENCQARERTQILMDYANKENLIVLGTGDLSELALGWCTYNGDHMSMYAVNCSVPKTLVKFLVRWASKQMEFSFVKEELESICNTAISPELLPPDEKGNIQQKTEDTIGPYELHDFFLYYHIRWNFIPEKIAFLTKKAFGDKYSEEEINKWLNLFYKRFFASQFKRSCIPDGPKVGSISLSPRGDWRMPSDASYNEWNLS